MSALASLERVGEEDLFFINWRWCRQCLQNEWPPLVNKAENISVSGIHAVAMKIMAFLQPMKKLSLNFEWSAVLWLVERIVEGQHFVIFLVYTFTLLLVIITLICITMAKSFYSVKYGSSNVTSFILSNIFFCFMSFQTFFQTTCNMDIFFYCFGFNLKKKSCRKSFIGMK